MYTNLNYLSKMSYNLIEFYSNKYFISSRRDYLEPRTCTALWLLGNKVETAVQKLRTYFDIA